jgi:hypothetical protein
VHHLVILGASSIFSAMPISQSLIAVDPEKSRGHERHPELITPASKSIRFESGLQLFHLILKTQKKT